jgi:hypothetical protein
MGLATMAVLAALVSHQVLQVRQSLVAVAVAEVRKKAEVLVVLAVQVAAVLAQFQHQTELLETLTLVAVVAELVDRQAVLAVQESSSFVIQIRSER